MLAFLVGLGTARFGAFNPTWLFTVVPFCVLFSKQRTLLFVYCVVLVAFFFGWWRGSIVMHRLAAYEPLQLQKVVLRASADNDSIYGDRSQLTFDATDIQVIEPHTAKLVGKIKVAGFGVPMVYRGDTVKVQGKLFKTRGSHQASISFANISVEGHRSSLVDRLRRRFSAGMQAALPEPLASFALGLLIGQRTTIPESVNQRLSTVGLTHLVAVSGYNLTILVLAVRHLLGKRSKYQSTVLSLLLIGLFLMVTGLSASIVRAALVSLLSIGAWYYGRTLRPLLLLSLVAALTAGLNPLYLWSDIGWYLSFLAFFGVLVIAPMLTERLFGNKKVQPLTLVLIETISAQLMAAPLIMYIFGQISLVAIVSNLIVVPLVPLAMLLSLIAGLGGMFLPTVAGWIAWPARILLTYIIDIVTALSNVPHALANRSLMLWQMLSLYGLVILTTLIIWRSTHKNAKITDKKQLITSEV